MSITTTTYVRCDACGEEVSYVDKPIESVWPSLLNLGWYTMRIYPAGNSALADHSWLVCPQCIDVVAPRVRVNVEDPERRLNNPRRRVS
jgi:hypothetical protein